MEKGKKQTSKVRLVYGVGINDADYTVSHKTRVGNKTKLIWVCPFYHCWKEMLKRGYSESFKKVRPSYIGVEVCKEWHTFSTFKAWMEKQDWEGKHLDKDVLVKGCKLYSPETCVFVDPWVNSFITEDRRSTAGTMTGAYYRKDMNKYRAHCHNGFSEKQEHLGFFSKEIDAHLAWKKRKHELACQLADSEYVTDVRVAEALRTRYI